MRSPMFLLPLFLALTSCGTRFGAEQLPPLKDGPVVVFFGGMAEPYDGNGMRAVVDRVAAARPDMTVTTLNWFDSAADPAGKLWTGYKGQKIVLVGHSFGGDKAILVSRLFALHGNKVDLLVLYDPVPISHWGFLNFVDYALPDNVNSWICLYRHAVLPPYSCPVRLWRWKLTNEIDHTQARGDERNVNLRIRFPGGHSSLGRHPDAQDLLVKYITAVR